MFHKYLNQKGYKWIFERTFDDLNCQCILFGPLRVLLVNLKLQSLLKVFKDILFNQCYSKSTKQSLRKLLPLNAQSKAICWCLSFQQKPLEAHQEPEERNVSKYKGFAITSI
jgi:hypothetical protein